MCCCVVVLLSAVFCRAEGGVTAYAIVCTPNFNLRAIFETLDKRIILFVNFFILDSGLTNMYYV